MCTLVQQLTFLMSNDGKKSGVVEKDEGSLYRSSYTFRVGKAVTVNSAVI